MVFVWLLVLDRLLTNQNSSRKHDEKSAYFHASWSIVHLDPFACNDAFVHARSSGLKTGR
jgi:hypothetical protein